MNDLDDFGIENVLKAAANIEDEVTHTPLLSSRTLDELANGRIFLKAENFQRSGSFKFRGALNKLLSTPSESLKNGVVACSSGNHAQGVALAAKILGMPATIVMPSDAPAIKISRTKAFGGRVVEYDRSTEDREAIARDLCNSEGAVFVHPYNDLHVIAGQGTSALEALNQLSLLGMKADNYLVCTGGGGLTAGTAVVLGHESPDTSLFTVEPDGFDDHARSFSSGKIERNEQLGDSICDALLAPEPGKIAFEINRHRVKRGLTVSEEEVIAAVEFAFHELKLVVEPGGAVALAAILAGKIDFSGGTTVCVLSGGNMDSAMLMRCLNDVELIERQK